MQAKTGWIAAAVILAVLLLGTVMAVIVLAANGSGANENKAASDKVAELEDKVTTLEGDVARANAEATAARQTAATQLTGNNGNSGSSGSSGSGSTGTTSNKTQVEALALAIANGNGPGIAWRVGETVIDGDWARVSVGCPSDHSVQGENLYFHKVGGSWQFVDCGTGLCYGDIPGAPASIFD